jgi:dehydrogenase/reductase SDR family protein 12
VFMVCRNPQRANAARDQIISEIRAVGTADNKHAAQLADKLHVIICDCSSQAEVTRAWNEFLSFFADQPPVRLDGVVCNAGAMFNTPSYTSEGVESTFALHLLQGTYFLVRTAMDTLKQTPGSRVVVVSSAGMYNVNFPNYIINESIQPERHQHVIFAPAETRSRSSSSATSATPQPHKYDGQLAYAYAKRGQVLLCEHWSAVHPDVKFVSCHPGWTQTEAVDAGETHTNI